MASLDDYVGNPAEFQVLDRWIYLNHAGVSPLPTRVAAAMRRYVDCYQGDAYLAGNTFSEVDACRLAMARLINAAPAEVALLKNTAEAISTVAFALEWRRGDRVVIPACEYPANIYPWMEVARRHGVEVIFIPERDQPDGTRAVDEAEILQAAGHEKCKVVALSHVQYGSGQRMDVARIGRWCRDNGRLLCVDAIQSLGALPVDVAGMNIDFLAAGSQKWLLGPMGSAILYVRQELTDLIRPLAVGAYSVANPEPYDQIDYTLAPDARRHESGSFALSCLMGLRAAGDMLLEIGPEAIQTRVKAVTDLLVDQLRDRGCKIVSPRAANRWSGIVSFLPPGEQDLPAVARRLRAEHKIELLVRDHRLRAAPHFYNTFEQMRAVADAI